MGLIDFNPVSWIESAVNAKLEREEINAIASAAYSSWLSGMWRSGDSKWAAWFGEGAALKDAAVAAYASLAVLQKPGGLVLTVPKDLLAALPNFQTQYKEKK